MGWIGREPDLRACRSCGKTSDRIWCRSTGSRAAIHRRIAVPPKLVPKSLTVSVDSTVLLLSSSVAVTSSCVAEISIQHQSHRVYDIVQHRVCGATCRSERICTAATQEAGIGCRPLANLKRVGIRWTLLLSGTGLHSRSRRSTEPCRRHRRYSRRPAPARWSDRRISQSGSSCWCWRAVAPSGKTNFISAVSMASVDG